MHGEDHGRTSAIVLERVRLDRISDQAAVGEPADTAGRIARDALPQPAIVNVAAVAVGGEPVFDGEVVAGPMQHGESSIGAT